MATRAQDGREALEAKLRQTEQAMAKAEGLLRQTEQALAKAEGIITQLGTANNQLLLMIEEKEKKITNLQSNF